MPPRRAPLPVRVSRRSQLITALRQRVRPIVIEDQELACPFARLLRARELQVWAPGEVVADTMSYSIARCYGTDIEGQWHMGRYVLPGNVEKVILKPKQDVGQTAMMVPRAAARPRNVSGSTPLSHVKRLSTTERPSDAAGGLPCCVRFGLWICYVRILHANTADTSARIGSSIRGDLGRDENAQVIGTSSQSSIRNTGAGK